MYNPIVGASENSSNYEPAVTPASTLDRVVRLGEEYESLRTDLVAEVNAVDERMIKPAMEAKDCIQPLKKVIKKRDDKKVSDYRSSGFWITENGLTSYGDSWILSDTKVE